MKSRGMCATATLEVRRSRQLPVIDLVGEVVFVGLTLSALSETVVGIVESVMESSSCPTLDRDWFDTLERESAFFNFGLSAGLLDLLLASLSPFRKASIAFLRTTVMFLFDLKSAGAPPVMKMRPPSLADCSLAEVDRVSDFLRSGSAIRWPVSLRSSLGSCAVDVFRDGSGP
jgi:hypothetical protein